MKIGVITSLFPNHLEPNRGIFTMKLLGRLNYSIFPVIAPVPWFPMVEKNRKRGISKREKILGMTVFHPYFFSFPKILKSLDAVFFFLSLLPYRRLIKKCDMIYASYGYPDGVGAWMLARRLGKPFSITLHRGDLMYWAKRPLVREQMAAMIRSADSVILVSHQLRDHLPQSVHNRVFIVSNGVDTETFRPIDSYQARKALSIPTERKVLFSVGNSFRRKGYFELVRAIHAISDSKLFLLIAGKDPDEQEALESLVESLGEGSRVKLLGEIPNNRLPLYYASADLYCLASHSEGWPCSVMEALSCGKPCVVTPKAAGEFINPGIGIVVEHSKLSQGIEKALGQKWNSAKIRAFAKQHTWDSVARKTELIFKIRK